MNSPPQHIVERAARAASRFLLLWIVLFGLLAYYVPAPFLPIGGYIRALLALIMFGMGITLTFGDFRRVLIAPKAVCAGMVGQFIAMPLAGYLIARLLRLPPELAVGTILVGTCPSGTASNVIAYLARADVALSVTLTAVNTLLAPVLTPLLLKFYAGEYVPVDAGQMFTEILSVVVIPTFAGLLLNHFFPRTARRLSPFAPMLSVVGIVLIVSFIIANNSHVGTRFPAILVLSVALHNAAGYLSGYWIGRATRLPENQCRTIAIELGIQNSALDIQLAKKFYAHLPAMALPGAFFSVWQNISGPALAAWWGREKQPMTAHPAK